MRGSPVTVTTVVPTFNRAALLPRAVRSALAQTHQDVVVHILDNASTDDTAEVAAELVRGDSRVHYTRRDENVGLCENFARGLAAVDTPYFSCLADDDWLAPRCYESALAGFARHPAAGFSGGITQWVLEDGSPLPTTRAWSRAGYHPPGESLIPMFSESFVCWTGLVFRTAAVEAVGGFDPSIGVAADMDLVIRVESRFGVVVEPDVVAYAVTSETTASGSMTHRGTWDSWERVLATATAFPVDPAAIDLLRVGLRPAAWRAGMESLHNRDRSGAFRSARALRASGDPVRAAGMAMAACVARYFPSMLPALRAGARVARLPPAPRSAVVERTSAASR